MHTATARTGLDRFFEAQRTSSLRRSNDKRVAGVCGAVAERFGIDPKMVRIATVVLAFVSPMVALYLIAWVLLPGPHGPSVFERAARGGETGAIVLSVLATLVALSDLGIRVRLLWPMLIVGAIVALVLHRAGTCGRRSSRQNGNSPHPEQATYAQPVYGQQGYGQPAGYGPAPYGPNAPQDAPTTR